MKLLPFIVSAVFVVVALVLTIAVANSTNKQQTVTASGLHSAEFMRLYERNRRFDVNGLGCNTPLGEFDLRCALAQDHVAQSGDAD